MQNWLKKDHQDVDSLCLQETKVSRDIIKQRLKLVHPKLIWFHSTDNGEIGGATTRLDPRLQIKEILCSELSSPNWIEVRVGDTFPYAMISIYVGGTIQNRADMWKEFTKIRG